jgi:putative oxidoreductase
VKVGRLLLRTTVGGLMIGHGTQKLFGAFDGEGLAATAATFEQVGLKPGKPFAVASGTAETLGGAGLLFGYQTPLAASAVAGSMAVAIERVHFKNGPWVQKGGYEYPLVLGVAAIVLADLGPGKLSIDSRKGHTFEGRGWPLFALAAAVAGAAGVRLLAQRTAGSEPASADAPTAPDAPAAATAAPVAEPAPVVVDATVTEATSDGSPAEATDTGSEGTVR